MEPLKTELLVLGAGPGGYTAAFYAADKGKKVVLVDRDKRLGGVCLNRGCIPSKALLHATQLLRQAAHARAHGIHFNPPEVKLDRLRAWKESVIDKLSQGISTLAQKRNVTVLCGWGHFEDSRTLRVETREGQKFVTYDKAIIAVGSKPAMPSAFDLGNRRIMTSDEALDIEEVPEKLLIVGGGYIGMELGTVYATLGSNVVLVEALGALLLGADADLVRPVARYAEQAFREVRLNTKVVKMATSGRQIKVTMEQQKQKLEELYDRVLVSVGRVPNCANLGLENTKVARDEKGFIKVNSQLQTSDPAIFAIGDVVGGALLAHKAFKEARVAVDSIIGEENSMDHPVIPAVVFTDPEVAWCGLTEAEAKAKGIRVEVARFPWAASGRALGMDRPDGLTKLIIDPDTERVLGVGIVGAGAGELISEGALAVEMGATAQDIGETIHPHPTLSETLKEAAEVFYGSSTHTLARKRKPAAPAEAEPERQS
ncbi:MAG TPA: dihydrolipoyl dehydrogenase [Candidatus Acidoferrales bacterium]|nr:dihydrolipoyl dehydrogenase [Candidatus Acidoferrales bacterium]